MRSIHSGRFLLGGGFAEDAAKAAAEAPFECRADDVDESAGLAEVISLPARPYDREALDELAAEASLEPERVSPFAGWLWAVVLGAAGWAVVIGAVWLVYFAARAL